MLLDGVETLRRVLAFGDNAERVVERLGCG